MRNKIVKDFKKNKMKYLFVIPVLIYLALFAYKPMAGIIIAFKKYRPALGIDGSPWVGFDNFIRFFENPDFWRVLRNTFTISALSLVFLFPAGIILALLLNEVKVSWFKRTVQTISYIPHFVALVVVCGMVSKFCQSDGVINDIIVFFGGERSNLLLKSEFFYPVHILSGIWQEMGWNSIIFLAALSSIDQEQYEAAKIDGAGRLQQLWYITLPGLMPTISMMFILRMGSVLSVGADKVLLLYNEMTYSVADVISTYVYRMGLINADFSYSTAVGLFNSVVNVIFLLAANKLSKKMGQSGLF